MDISSIAKDATSFTRTISEANPSLLGPYMLFIRRVSEDGALDTKTKELIAVALSVALKCKSCIAYHGRNALEHGATSDELLEACMVAVMMAGTSSLMNLKVLKEVLNF